MYCFERSSKCRFQGWHTISGTAVYEEEEPIQKFFAAHWNTSRKWLLYFPIST